MSGRSGWSAGNKGRGVEPFSSPWELGGGGSQISWGWEAGNRALAFIRFFPRDFQEEKKIPLEIWYFYNSSYFIIYQSFVCNGFEILILAI